jgi:segregation and condensation protein B
MVGVSAVAELPLDLDAFEGPFDLLLTLVLKEELELADVEIVEIVLTFLEERRGDLEVDGEFLVLVASLLELKARGLFPDEEEVPFEDLDPDDAAGELAERLAQYRRFRAAAGWLEEKLDAESDRYFRLGPAPLAPVPERPLAPQEPECLASALRALAAEPPTPSLRHITLTFPPVSLFLERFRAVLRRAARAAQGGGDRHRASCPLRGDHRMEQRSLRVLENPVDRLARTIEALLVIAPSALSVEELAGVADDETERVETALGLLASRYREGRSGIVLEQVAGGYAFRAAREAAEACARLVERPAQRGLSQAALETLAIVAYLGPVSRPEIARIRGVAADSAVAGLVERGLIAEAGRDKEGGAIRYQATPLFERVFGLAGLSELPRLDDLAGDDEGLRARLEEVAGRRGA